MTKLKYLGAITLSGLMLASTAIAAEFIAPEKNGSGVIELPASESHKNLHVAGGILTVNSQVLGDLFAAGGIIKVTGNIEVDAFLAGGRIDLDAAVGKNVHVAGGNIYVNKSIGGDLVAAGGVVEVSENSTIAGDLVVGGGEIIVNGKVAGNLLVSAGKSLTFGAKSEVTGKITYYGNNDPIIKDGAKLGTIERHALPMHRRLFGGTLLGAGLIVMLLAWLAAGLLLLYLLKPELTKATVMMRSEPWANLGIGLISLIVGPILIVLLLITLVGYYIAILVLLWYLFALMLSCLVAAVFLGRWLYHYFDKDAAGIDWKIVLTGVIAFKILQLIPILGWIICAVLSLMAFGVILRMARHQVRRQE